MTTAALEPRALRGLAAATAAARLREDGPNELPAARPRSVVVLVWDVVAEPMIALLVAVGVVYLLLGDREQALLLLVSIAIVIAIDLVQQHRSERALAALRDLTSPRACVIRDGETRRIPGREVVREDLVVVAEGDRVPADADLVWGPSLLVDESLLTGESVPVRKRAGGAAAARPGGDDTARVFSGTLVVQGRGVAQVVATGAASEIGRIGRSLATLEPETSPLAREIAGLVRVVGVAAMVVCVLAALVYAVTRGAWLDGALVGLTLAVSLVPEEFPLVLTIFLALGARRLAAQRVLTRRIPAIEALGATTVLCVDKTGTLTENRMAVQALWTPVASLALPPGRRTPLPEAVHALVEFAILASQRDPFDPMERALAALGEAELAGTEHLHGGWRLEREYPLSPELLALSHVWAAPDARRLVVAAKGAPEAIADLCHLDPATAARVAAETDRLARDGLRVLGVARAFADATALPPVQHDFDFELVGLVGLADPIRPSVPRALAECETAGVRVVMITGDYPSTARAIARAAGFRRPDAVLTGPELDATPDAEVAARLREVDVCARMVPEHKLRLVRALQAGGEIVAMTGDGVNDAPALRAAHIGIAMGARGTDVAREAAAIVLVDDDLGSIVDGLRMGRRIYGNLKKAVAFIVAVHVAIAGVALVPVLLGWPLVLMPVHVLFLELLIDPACSVVFEAERAPSDVMRRPPRDPSSRLLGRGTLLACLLEGAGALAVVLAAFAAGAGGGEATARAWAFTALVGADLGLILVSRSETHALGRMLSATNAALWIVVAGALAALALILGVPALREAFRLAPVPWTTAGACLLAGIASVAWLDLLAPARRIHASG